MNQKTKKKKKILNDNSNNTTATMTVLLNAYRIPGLVLSALHIFIKKKKKKAYIIYYHYTCFKSEKTDAEICHLHS